MMIGNYFIIECPLVLSPTSQPSTGSQTIISTSKFAICIISAVVGGVILGLFCGVLLNRKNYRRQSSELKFFDMHVLYKFRLKKSLCYFNPFIHNIVLQKHLAKI